MEEVSGSGQLVLVGQEKGFHSPSLRVLGGGGGGMREHVTGSGLTLVVVHRCSSPLQSPAFLERPFSLLSTKGRG